MYHDQIYHPILHTCTSQLRDAVDYERAFPCRFARFVRYTEISTNTLYRNMCNKRSYTVYVTRMAPSTPHRIHTFSAKEKDTETGLSVTSLRSVSSSSLSQAQTSLTWRSLIRRFGSRYYSSDLSIWLSVDPMSDKYPSLSPYVYCANNPIKLVDPDGEEVWIPEIDKKGNVTYTAEKGDSFQTFINQFECSKENGENIFSKSKLSTKDFIKEGSKITGEDVKEYTGNDVLKGKWYNMTQNQQASQIKFALMYGEKHNLTVEDQYAINLNDFISGFSTPYDGLVLNNVKIPENGSMINVNMRVWPKGGLTDNKGRIPIYYGGYSGGEGGRSLYFYSAKNPNARNFLPAILITQY